MDINIYSVLGLFKYIQITDQANSLQYKELAVLNIGVIQIIYRNTKNVLISQLVEN